MRYVEYRADSEDEFPFHKIHNRKKSKKMKGPSGSTWQGRQLKWLGVDHHIGCNLEDIAPEDRRVAPRIAELIDHHLSMTLEHIRSAKLIDLSAFYFDLRTLLTVDPRLSLYEKSSTYDGSSQPRGAHTPSPSSSPPRFLMDSPSATQRSGVS